MLSYAALVLGRAYSSLGIFLVLYFGVFPIPIESSGDRDVPSDPLGQPNIRNRFVYVRYMHVCRQSATLGDV